MTDEALNPHVKSTISEVQSTYPLLLCLASTEHDKGYSNSEESILVPEPALPAMAFNSVFKIQSMGQ